MQGTDTAGRWRQQRGKLLIGALALLAAGWWAQARWRGPEQDTLTVQRRDFVQTVVASGRVASPHRMDLGAQVTGTVLAVPVAEGQHVAAGQLLVQLNAEEARATLAQAELAVQQAQARLRQLRELQAPVAEQTLRQARATADTARAAAERQQALFRQGFINQAALDESARALEVAEAQWRSAQLQVATTRPGGSDLALAEAALVQAAAAADAARARLAYQQLRAPAAGTLIARSVEPGEVVQAGKALLTLSPDGPTQLVLQIDEKNLRLLRAGQPALASADADPQQRFGATLVYLNPGVNAQTGAVEVRLDVPAPPALLRQDMTVSVDIEVARRPQALLLPAEALREAAGSPPWVLKVDQGQARRQPLRIGLRSPGWVEVLDGVQAGDAVLPASSQVTEGQRVRPRAASAP